MILFLKKAAAALAAASSVLCVSSCSTESEMRSETYYDMFDTYVTVMAYEEDAALFEENCKKIKDTLTECSALFDIYREYEGCSNLCTVNKNAGIAPVKVDGRIISLVEYGIDVYEKTEGTVNIAMGSVLEIWHDCREQNNKEGADTEVLPDEAALASAAEHTDINKVRIDRDRGTIYLEDSEMSLDVGAIAKGYAADCAAKMLRDGGTTEGYALNLGGNVIVLGEKRQGEAWQISVQSPYEDNSSRIARIEARDASLVTSGVYERYFTAGGKRYHHIIDPATLYPSEYFDGVSVLGAESALCDALSTALFCMPLERGQALIASIDGVEAVWVKDGQIYKSAGFPENVE